VKKTRAKEGPMMALLRAAAVLPLALAANLAYAAEIDYLAPPGLPAKQFPAPHRAVAPIVSPTRADEQYRDSLNEAAEIARLLELKAGMTIADIGAGSGYHTVRLSQLVGAAGSVIAEDVTPEYLNELAERIERLKLTNVVLALGEPHDPRLPASSLDAAILVHMYHEIAQPYAFLYNLAPALKEGGSGLSTSSGRHRSTARRSSCCVANWLPSAIAKLRRIGSRPTSDIWRCSPRPTSRIGNLPAPSRLAETIPAVDRRRTRLSKTRRLAKTKPA
jgi:ubiquinone/menaquinone biosynthesis C-methylase UbiE